MGHRWRFFRAGGVDQVRIESGADLLALGELDQKLWVALQMPTRDVDVDPVTMDLLDADRDGRVRVPDILGAVEWIRTAFRRPDDLLEPKNEVPLAAIADPKIEAAARRVLADLGKGQATAVSVADAVAIDEAFVHTRLNGDGIVIPASTDDAELAALITTIGEQRGTVSDRSGKPGIDQARVDGFFADVDAVAAWLDRRGGDPALLPLGEATDAAADLFARLRPKLEDWLARCQLAAFDPRAAGALAGKAEELETLASRELHTDSAEIARLPLARIDPSGRLSLGAGVNPAWAASVRKLADEVVAPLLGARDSLGAGDVVALAAKLAPFDAWRKAKPDTKLGDLPAARVLELARGDHRRRLSDLIAADKALEAEYAQIASVGKLVHLQRDFARVLRSFVSFADFYGKKDGAFQAGTLYIDGRACRLCVPVADAGKHAALAGSSEACLVYCDVRRAGGHKQIVAAVTNGDADNLFVGRNGVFYDRKGQDWDATVTKIVSNPISVRQAFWSPYKKVVRLIEEQVAKRASAAEAAGDARLTETATSVAVADQAAVAAARAPSTAPRPEPKKIDVGTVAAIGVAVGGIGAMVAGILGAFFGLGLWMPVGVVALILAISGPSMLLAWLKLRRRNLGPLLDANGWAINGRARVNVAFGAAMTDLASLPPGASRSLDDPYADARTPWKRIVLVLLLLALLAVWGTRVLDPLLPKAIRFGKVVHLVDAGR